MSDKKIDGLPIRQPHIRSRLARNSDRPTKLSGYVRQAKKHIYVAYQASPHQLLPCRKLGQANRTVSAEIQTGKQKVELPCRQPSISSRPAGNSCRPTKQYLVNAEKQTNMWVAYQTTPHQVSPCRKCRQANKAIRNCQTSKKAYQASQHQLLPCRTITLHYYLSITLSSAASQKVK